MTKDLDPVYVLVYNSKLTGKKLHEWLLAYWCFYHVGTASWILDQSDYWKAMETAAGSKEYLRSSERRHYRGGQALRSVAWLKELGVQKLFSPLVGKNLTAPQCIELVKKWKGFGQWISFKVADMLGRLGVSKIKFDSETAMYESPLNGAKLLWSIENEGIEEPENVGEWAFGRLAKKLGYLKAPPRFERNLDVEEYETILCKYKSYMGGHYHVTEDIESCKLGLEKYNTKTCNSLLEAGVIGGLWS